MAAVMMITVQTKSAVLETNEGSAMRLLAYIRTLPEHLRFRLGPTVVRWLTSLSTMPARRRLLQDEPLAILVDNSVLSSAVTHESGWISTGPKMWGPHEIYTGHMARIPVHSAENDTEHYRNITYLAGIAHLADVGRLKLCTSAELRDEQFRQPGGRFNGYGYFDHSVFGRIKLECVDKLMGSWALHPGGPSLRDQQAQRINGSNDPLFRALLNRLGEKQSFDAWHIRTAEVHGLYCFLTTDFKLRRSVERWRDYEPFKSLKTKVMTPAEFGEAFGIIPLPTFLHSYTDASFFVRTDLHMPQEKRRPVSAYRNGKR